MSELKNIYNFIMLKCKELMNTNNYEDFRDIYYDLKETLFLSYKLGNITEQQKNYLRRKIRGVRNSWKSMYIDYDYRTSRKHNYC